MTMEMNMKLKKCDIFFKIFVASILIIGVNSCSKKKTPSEVNEAWDWHNAPERITAFPAKPYDQYQLQH